MPAVDASTVLEDRLAPYHEAARLIFIHATMLGDYDLEDQPDYALYWEVHRERVAAPLGKTVICGHSLQKSGVPKVVPGRVSTRWSRAAGG